LAAAAERDPANASVRLDIARTYLALGGAETELGLAAPEGSASRRSHCEAARGWLESARSSEKEMGTPALLAPADGDPGDVVDRELQRCVS